MVTPVTRQNPSGIAVLICSLAIALAGTGLLGEAASAAAGQRVAVAVAVANVRAGPGHTYPVLWNAEKYYPLQVVATSGEWHRFKDFEGDEGWIHKSLTKPIATVITRKSTCNIRSGPGTNFAVLSTVSAGIPFKVLETKGRWMHVQHADGDQGWIHRVLIW